MSTQISAGEAAFVNGLQKLVDVMAAGIRAKEAEESNADESGGGGGKKEEQTLEESNNADESGGGGGKKEEQTLEETMTDLVQTALTQRFAGRDFSSVVIPAIPESFNLRLIEIDPEQCVYPWERVSKARCMPSARFQLVKNLVSCEKPVYKQVGIRNFLFYATPTRMVVADEAGLWLALRSFPVPESMVIFSADATETVEDEDVTYLLKDVFAGKVVRWKASTRPPEWKDCDSTDLVFLEKLPALIFAGAWHDAMHLNNVQGATFSPSFFLRNGQPCFSNGMYMLSANNKRYWMVMDLVQQLNEDNDRGWVMNPTPRSIYAILQGDFSWKQWTAEKGGWSEDKKIQVAPLQVTLPKTVMKGITLHANRRLWHGRPSYQGKYASGAQVRLEWSGTGYEVCKEDEAKIVKVDMADMAY